MGAALIAALVAVVVGAPGVALAEDKRIVILDFTGPDAEKVQRAITKELRKRHRVLSAKRYTNMARKLDARKPSNRNVAKISERIRADGIIVGTVQRRGSRRNVLLKLRAGRDGRVVETLQLTTRKGKLSKANKRALRDTLSAAIDDLTPLASNLDEEEEDEEEDEAVEDEEEEEDEEDEDEADVDDEDKDDEGDDAEEFDDEGDDDEGIVSGDGDDDDDDGDSDPSPLTDEERADRAIRGRGLVAGVGLSVIGRNLSFTVADGLGDLGPQGYSGSPVPGALITAELYPLAFNKKNRGITRDIGVSATLDRVLKIESQFAFMDGVGGEEVVALDTLQQRFGVGVIFRYNLGSSPMKPTIKLSVRYNRMKFIIDKESRPAGTPEPDIPNVDYTYVDPGVGIRFPVNAKITLNGEGRFLLITDTGEMQAEDQYGSATVSGFDVDANVEYALNPRLSLRLGGRFMGFAFDFDGNGDQTVLRDGDESTIDVGGALDQYLGGYLTAGYLF